MKTAYAQANRALGDIVKVTPSSKVVGDLAQFMVQNSLDEQQLLEKADNLSLPSRSACWWLLLYCGSTSAKDSAIYMAVERMVITQSRASVKIGPFVSSTHRATSCMYYLHGFVGRGRQLYSHVTRGAELGP